jgi:VIT1/CCC1 family predicted Fe2+/Mn2+ transporter
LIADALPPLVARLLQPAELEGLRERLARIEEPAGAGRLQKEDYRGAVGVFLLVFLSTFPVAIPFMVMTEAQPAMRVSNAVAVVLLFTTGYAFGRITGRQPWLVGCGMVVLGLVLVGLTMALGG